MLLTFSSLHNLDLLLGEAVEGVDELVELVVGGGDLALEHGLLVGGIGGGESLVEVEHGLDQVHHLVVPGLVGGIGQTDREPFEVLTEETEVRLSRTLEGCAGLCEIEVGEPRVQQAKHAQVICQQWRAP